MLDKKIVGFKQTVREFLASKSNWTGLTMIIGGAIGLYQKADVSTSVTAIMGGLSLLFIRDGIAG